jgi:hypothetical protein
MKAQFIRTFGIQKSISKNELITMSAYIKKSKSSQIKKPNGAHQFVSKQEQTNPKSSRHEAMVTFKTLEKRLSLQQTALRKLGINM